MRALVDGYSDVMVGIIDQEIQFTPMRNVWSRKKDIDYDLLQLAQLLN